MDIALLAILRGREVVIVRWYEDRAEVRAHGDSSDVAPVPIAPFTMMLLADTSDVVVIID